MGGLDGGGLLHVDSFHVLQDFSQHVQKESTYTFTTEARKTGPHVPKPPVAGNECDANRHLVFMSVQGDIGGVLCADQAELHVTRARDSWSGIFCRKEPSTTAAG